MCDYIHTYMLFTFVCVCVCVNNIQKGRMVCSVPSSCLPVGSSSLSGRKCCAMLQTQRAEAPGREKPHKRRRLGRQTESVSWSHPRLRHSGLLGAQIYLPQQTHKPGPLSLPLLTISMFFYHNYYYYGKKTVLLSFLSSLLS